MDEVSRLLLEELGPERNDKIYAIYKYGSRVYGTLHEYSDYDFIIITNDSTLISVNIPHVDINTCTLENFQVNLDNNEIWALECVFSTPVYSTYTFDYKIEIQKLRAAVSKNSSQTFNKAKKKFLSPYDREGELIRGKKALFHSLRVLLFGIQIAKHQRIIDYHEANHYFNEIMSNTSNKWEDYLYLKPKYNALMTTFRKIAPKV
jgi:predicted nucleotidyltransferase